VQSIVYTAHNDGSGDSVTGLLTIDVPRGTTLTTIGGGGCTIAVPVAGPAAPSCTTHQLARSGANATQTVTGTFAVSRQRGVTGQLRSGLSGASPDLITGQPLAATPVGVPLDKLTDTTLTATRTSPSVWAVR